MKRVKILFLGLFIPSMGFGLENFYKKYFNAKSLLLNLVETKSFKDFLCSTKIDLTEYNKIFKSLQKMLLK